MIFYPLLKNIPGRAYKAIFNLTDLKSFFQKYDIGFLVKLDQGTTKSSYKTALKKIKGNTLNIEGASWIDEIGTFNYKYKNTGIYSCDEVSDIKSAFMTIPYGAPFPLLKNKIDLLNYYYYVDIECETITFALWGWGGIEKMSDPDISKYIDYPFVKELSMKNLIPDKIIDK